MKKYKTVKDYAKQKNLTTAAIYKQINGRNINCIEVSRSLEKLMEFPNNDTACIISLMNLKGGCGKTTLSVHLAIMLSKLNFKVLLIDTDHQNQCQLFFLPQSYEYTLKNLLANECTIDKAIYQQKTKTSVLDIIYSDYNLAIWLWKRDLDNVMEKLLSPIKNNYDFIIIDTSPAFDVLASSIVKATDYIIIPVEPDSQSISGLEHFLQAIETAININIKKKILGIIPNKVRTKQSIDSIAIEELQKIYSDLIFSFIRASSDLPSATAVRTNIFDYKEKSNVSQDLKNFIWEILQRI